MARTKVLNPALEAMSDEVRDYMRAKRELEQEYAVLARKEIERKRIVLQDRLFRQFAEAGDSEIANSTGLSRSTVIRWRKEYNESDKPEVTPEFLVPITVEDAVTFGVATPSWQSTPILSATRGGETVWLIAAPDSYVPAETLEEAGETLGTWERPEWLTTQMIEGAEADFGVSVYGFKG